MRRLDCADEDWLDLLGSGNSSAVGAVKPSNAGSRSGQSVPGQALQAPATSGSLGTAAVRQPGVDRAPSRGQLPGRQLSARRLGQPAAPGVQDSAAGAEAVTAAATASPVGAAGPSTRLASEHSRSKDTATVGRREYLGSSDLRAVAGPAAPTAAPSPSPPKSASPHKLAGSSAEPVVPAGTGRGATARPQGPATGPEATSLPEVPRNTAAALTSSAQMSSSRCDVVGIRHKAAVVDPAADGEAASISSRRGGQPDWLPRKPSHEGLSGRPAQRIGQSVEDSVATANSGSGISFPGRPLHTDLFGRRAQAAEPAAVGSLHLGPAQAAAAAASPTASQQQTVSAEDAAAGAAADSSEGGQQEPVVRAAQKVRQSVQPGAASTAAAAEGIADDQSQQQQLPARQRQEVLPPAKMTSFDAGESSCPKFASSRKQCPAKNAWLSCCPWAAVQLGVVAWQFFIKCLHNDSWHLKTGIAGGSELLWCNVQGADTWTPKLCACSHKAPQDSRQACHLPLAKPRQAQMQPSLLT